MKLPLPLITPIACILINFASPAQAGFGTGRLESIQDNPQPNLNEPIAVLTELKYALEYSHDYLPGNSKGFKECAKKIDKLIKELSRHDALTPNANQLIKDMAARRARDIGVRTILGHGHDALVVIQTAFKKAQADGAPGKIGNSIEIAKETLLSVDEILKQAN
ncbi:MAG: hypothetical protein WCO60_17105 [Verrucomicrobiota bacterium]